MTRPVAGDQSASFQMRKSCVNPPAWSLFRQAHDLQLRAVDVTCLCVFLPGQATSRRSPAQHGAMSGRHAMTGAIAVPSYDEAERLAPPCGRGAKGSRHCMTPGITLPPDGGPAAADDTTGEAVI